MTRRMNPFVGWALALLVAVGFVRLGVWQLHRAHEKQAMLDAAAQVLRDKVPRGLELANDPQRARQYDWASGEGMCANAPTVLLDNQAHKDQAGVRVYCLFKPRNRNLSAVLVEFGWVPLPPDRKLPVIDMPHDWMRVNGLLSPPPSRGLIAGFAAIQSNGEILTTSLDAAELPKLLQVDRLSQRVLRLETSKNSFFVRDFDVLPNTLPPAQHDSYAVQWFGLALAVLATAVILTLRRRRKAEHAKMRG